MAPAHYAALVLAAGESRRMGTAKAALCLSGRPLLEAHVQAFRTAGLHPVAVVLGHNAQRLQDELDLSAALPVLNPHYREGQFSSVRAGLRALIPPFLRDTLPHNPPDASTAALGVSPGQEGWLEPLRTSIQAPDPTETSRVGVFLTPVDCPPVPLELLLELRATHERVNAAAVIPTCQGRPGHPVILGREAITAALEAPESSNLEAVLTGLGTRVHRLETACAAILWNLNHPGDVADYLKANP